MIKLSKKQILYSYIIFIIIAIMTYGLISQTNKIENLNIGVIITFLCIGLIVVFNIIRDTKPYSLNKIFWYFNFFFLFLSPLLQYIGGYYPWNFYIENDVYLKCNCLILIWMILYTFGNVILDSKNKVKNKEKILNISNNEMLKSIIFSFIAFLILVILVGFKNLFLRENNTIDIGSDLINSIVQKFLRSIPVFSLALYIILTKKRKCKKSNIKFAILLILTIILNFPSSISRYWIGAVYLGLILTYFNKKMKNRTFDIIIIVTIAVIFPFFTLFKRNDIVTVFRSNIFLSIEEIYYNVDFDAYSMFARIIMYTKAFGFEYGKQLLCSLFFFIPRAIWINKPFPTGVMVATKQRAFYTNLSSPLISEAYVDFGSIGVCLYAIIISIIISYLDNIYWKREESNSVTLIEIIYPFMLGFILFLQRGAMQPVITHAFSFYLYIILRYLISKKNKKEEKNSEVFNN